MARSSQCVFSPVDATGPSKLEKVFRDNFLHSLDVEASPLAPKLFLEAFQHFAVVFVEFHISQKFFPNCSSV